MAINWSFEAISDVDFTARMKVPIKDNRMKRFFTMALNRAGKKSENYNVDLLDKFDIPEELLRGINHAAKPMMKNIINDVGKDGIVVQSWNTNASYFARKHDDREVWECIVEVMGTYARR